VVGKGVIVVPSAPAADSSRAATTTTPALERVANRPILAHVIDALVAAEIGDIAILARPELAEDVATCIREDRRDGVEVRCLTPNVEAEPALALEAVLDFAAGAPTVIHRGDGLLSQPLGPYLDALADDGTDLVVLMAEGARNVEQLEPAGQDALRVAALHPSSGAIGIAGVCVLGAEALERLGSEVKPLLTGGEQIKSIVEALLARRAGRPQLRIVRGWHAFAGEPRDLLDLNRAALDSLDHETSVPKRGSDNSFEGRVFIHREASVTSSVICGPVIIGPHAYIADSYIGPHTAIGERVRVEGSEVERSILLQGASILHVGGRLVSSVVGRNARVFRDFSVPRAFRLHVSDGNEVALC
jgi:glucose-1-phosphate thymidylyltransferase